MTDSEWVLELSRLFVDDDTDTAQRLTAIAVKLQTIDNLQLVVSDDSALFAYVGNLVTV